MIVVDAVAGSPWVLLVVFVVAGLDAIVPLSPSESTLIAVSVLAGSTGEPRILLVIAAAASGAFAGDLLSYRIGVRAGPGVLRRLQGKTRGLAAYHWARRTLRSRGGQVLVFARYLPGGRSASALAAGVVGYPAGRFQAWTALGVSLWASMAGLIGYCCGIYFEGKPWKALLFAYAGAAALLLFAEAFRRFSAPADQEVDPRADGGDGHGEGGLLEHDHRAGRADLADHPEFEAGGS
ncbi:VTT domain-containing protein [Dactylosporangium salmoneum]|uniref:VTT domain-containing protein n=1 Tax=Dactylosporangium salmoneum TaxID=53361 RepID=A0ABP5TCC7_9ACTN